MALPGRKHLLVIERLFERSPSLEFDGVVLEHHRDLRGGGLRAAIFGMSDGLVSNISLVLGTAGAHPGAGVVRLAGLAGLLGGSFSMAAGEYVSMRGQQEALQHELDVERKELQVHPESERRELEQIYVRRGITREVAQRVAEELMSSPESSLIAHAREELGIDPDALGSPIQASLASFFMFAIGAFIPLAPFLSGSSGSTAILVSITVAGIAAIFVGLALTHFTGRSKLHSAFRSLLICAIAGAVTYLVGSAIGVATH
jgi:VIT1/CCC1 family predicted Fe2+/Mn2+ transporter